MLPHGPPPSLLNLNETMPQASSDNITSGLCMNTLRLVRLGSLLAPLQLNAASAKRGSSAVCCSATCVCKRLRKRREGTLVFPAQARRSWICLHTKHMWGTVHLARSIVSGSGSNVPQSCSPCRTAAKHDPVPALMMPCQSAALRCAVSP